MSNKEKTLEDVSPEAFGLIMALNEKAYARLSEPDFVRVLPPRGKGACCADLFMGH